MLREADIRIDFGRAEHGGDFMRMAHVPTGIERWHPGPLAKVSRYELQQRWLREIEAEIAERGLMQHIVPEYPTKSTWQGRGGA